MAEPTTYPPRDAELGNVRDARRDGNSSRPQEEKPSQVERPSYETQPSSLDLNKSAGGETHSSGTAFPAIPYSTDPGPGFACIDGEVGGSGYNETKVDIVAVPCPGADPFLTWLGNDPFPDGYFGIPAQVELDLRPTVRELAGDAILSPAINRHLPKAAHLWVRQGIRKSASTARVLLYKHRPLTDGVTLEVLAQDLLDQVLKLRRGLVGSLARLLQAQRLNHDIEVI
jgi:hypothetical protein